MNDNQDTSGEAFIVVAGNPIDGLVFVGPFETLDDAKEWAEANSQGDWWIGDLDTPAAMKRILEEKFPKEKLPWSVTDWHGVKPGEQATILARFANHDDAAAWLRSHPEQERVIRGDFSLDGPAEG